MNIMHGANDNDNKFVPSEIHLKNILSELKPQQNYFGFNFKF